jgi:hypothetical protein
MIRDWYKIEMGRKVGLFPERVDREIPALQRASIML